MFAHVPLRDVALAAALALERPNTEVLPEMHFEVRSGIILLVTAWEAAVELEDVSVRFLVVSQDPQLSIAVVAARERALVLLHRVLGVGRHVVVQVLRHLK